LKRVIHFKTGPFLPITENWIYGQISGMKKYEPFVYACDAENLDIFPVKKIRTVKSPQVMQKGMNFRKLYFYLYFIHFLAKDNPDIIHAHFGPSGQRFLLLKRFFKLPLVTTFYGYDINQVVKQYPAWLAKYQNLFHQGTLFLVEGNHMKKSLMFLGCPEDKILVHHLGVDLENIKFVPRKIEDEEEIRVLIASSFREKKGIPYAVDAFGQFKNSNPQIKISLTIIGDSAEDRFGDRQKQLILDKIRRHHLQESVRMLGYQSHEVFIRELYNHHIFLSPSIHASDGDNEGGAPVSIIEASASGLPVLATLHCDIPEVVVEDKTGYLVPEKDVSSLKERLAFLVLNHQSWATIGSYGRKHIEQNYDVRTQIGRLEEIYDDVLSNRYGCL